MTSIKGRYFRQITDERGASEKCTQKYVHCIVLCGLHTSGLYNTKSDKEYPLLVHVYSFATILTKQEYLYFFMIIKNSMGNFFMLKMFS